MHQIPSIFNRYELTEEEAESGLLVNPVFLAILQNKHYDVTMQIKSIVFTGSREDRENAMIVHAGLVAQASLLDDLISDINAAFHNRMAVVNSQPQT